MTSDSILVIGKEIIKRERLFNEKALNNARDCLPEFEAELRHRTTRY
jgi:hypothetical protein